MNSTIGVLIGIFVGVLVLFVLFLLFEYRVRKPDFLLLYESNGKIMMRKGLVYPRHLSLPLERTTYPIRLTIEAAAVGNLEVRIKLVGSVAPSIVASDSVICESATEDNGIEYAFGSRAERWRPETTS